VELNFVSFCLNFTTPKGNAYHRVHIASFRKFTSSCMNCNIVVSIFIFISVQPSYLNKAFPKPLKLMTLQYFLFATRRHQCCYIAQKLFFVNNLAEFNFLQARHYAIAE
jgi:hypothetical protein